MDDRIAVVADPDFAGLDPLSSQMPVWIVHSPENRKRVEAVWKSSPHGPMLTIYDVSKPDSRVDNLLNVIPDVELHHYGMTELLIVGIEDSEALRSGLRSYFYELAAKLSEGWLATRSEPARPY